MSHLLVDISPHGFGHITQVAPVVNELARRLPGLRVTVRSTASGAVLAQRLGCAYDHLPLPFDFGMAMDNAVDVRVDESAAAYRAFHSDWARRVEQEAEALALLAPDLLLANVPYLSLAAASRAGVPAVGMCSLNWVDIYGHYCGHRPEGPEIRRQMLDAYNSAAAFLRVTPSMPMPDLGRARSIGPIAHPSLNRRAELAAALGVQPGEKLVLFAMGGLDFRLPVECWPRLPGVRWLVPAAWGVEREDMSAWETPGLPFSDVLASSDAVLAKTGYGTFVEAACAGVPVLYLARPDWPEDSWLVQWLQRNAACLEVARDTLEKGSLGGSLERLWSLPRPTPPVPTGAVEAADYLASFFP